MEIQIPDNAWLLLLLLLAFAGGLTWFMRMIKGMDNTDHAKPKQ